MRGFNSRPGLHDIMMLNHDWELNAAAMLGQQAEPRGGTEEILERRRENYPWSIPAQASFSRMTYWVKFARRYQA